MAKLKDYQEAIIRFYNRVSGKNANSIHDIPEDTLYFLSLLSHDDLVKAFAKEHQFDGFTMMQTSLKYTVTISQIRFWMGKGKKQKKKHMLSTT